MQWAFYRIPTTGGIEVEGLNKFLRSVRVLSVHREFVSNGEASFWALAVEYLPAVELSSTGGRAAGAGKVDFKNVLDPEDFALFARLREWRKGIANSEAIPVYTVFTNEQLAEMARRRCSSASALAGIDGVGSGRLDRYAHAVLEIIGAFANGAGEGTLPADS